ncbi:MAG: hypothetical protein P1T08_12925 [Acidimicrobiia bacterium]|nr:hypothetical protein [Acidimicrobiia bacterium]
MGVYRIRPGPKRARTLHGQLLQDLAWNDGGPLRLGRATFDRGGEPAGYRPQSYSPAGNIRSKRDEPNGTTVLESLESVVGGGRGILSHRPTVCHVRQIEAPVGLVGLIGRL